MSSSVRWSSSALQDFTQAVEYIARDNPGAAAMIAQTILDMAQSLEAFPGRGRPGRVQGTRELLVPSYPYRIVYTEAQPIRIVRILHDRQAPKLP